MTVNGKPFSAAGVHTVGDLLAHLDVRPERVVVELNGTIYRRGEGQDQAVHPDDVIEVVRIVGGG